MAAAETARATATEPAEGAPVPAIGDGSSLRCGGYRRGVPPTLAALTIADDPAAWHRAGFDVTDGSCRVGRIELRFPGEDDERGIRSWTLLGAPTDLVDVDGLATRAAADEPADPVPPHPNGATGVDHVVVGSPDRDRTVTALREHLGWQPRRQSEHELYGRAMIQTFYVVGDAVLEVISRPDDRGDGPSVFWGLAFVVEDLDATVTSLGEHVTAPKPAVQPGRRIATLRGGPIGISVPVAFLTPRV